MISRVIDYRLEFNRYKQVDLVGQNLGDLYVLAYFLEEADAAGSGTTSDDKIETKTLLNHRFMVATGSTGYHQPKTHFVYFSNSVGQHFTFH